LKIEALDGPIASGARLLYAKAMDQNRTPLERAFELAKSGDYADVTSVRARLKAEGYSDGQLEGPVLVRQLREIVKKARSEADRT
jgi:hypothetical protein